MPAHARKPVHKLTGIQAAGRTAAAATLTLAAIAAITSANEHRGIDVQSLSLDRTVTAAAEAAGPRSIDDPGADPGAAARSAQAMNPFAFPNNLDGWIRQSMVVMYFHGIPGSYNGIYRNVMRESKGDPMAINLWDTNAQAGIPSKGLLQVIDPTFTTYHVAGTSWNIYDPVANIAAACNYAAARYGSMDNVNSAY